MNASQLTAAEFCRRLAEATQNPALIAAALTLESALDSGLELPDDYFERIAKQMAICSELVSVPGTGFANVPPSTIHHGMRWLDTSLIPDWPRAEVRADFPNTAPPAARKIYDSSIPGWRQATDDEWFGGGTFHVDLHLRSDCEAAMVAGAPYQIGYGAGISDAFSDGSDFRWENPYLGLIERELWELGYRDAVAANGPSKAADPR